MKLPKGWGLLAMNKIGTVQAGRQRSPHHIAGELRPYLRVANVQDAWIDFSDVKEMAFTDKEFAIYELKSGDVLLSEGQSLELVGRPAIYRGELAGCCFQNTLVRLRPEGHVPDFVLYVCQYLYGLGVFQRIAKKTTSIAHLGVSRFAEVTAPTPPLPEQQKIAEILGTWDEALEKLDALIQAKDCRKKALMEQLLTGQKRVKGFSEQWKTRRFGEFLTESRVSGGDGSSAKKITVKLYGRGVVPKQERLAGSENTKYYIRSSGHFIYSKLDFLNGAFGIIPVELDGYESTLDLPAFIINENADPSWILNYVVRPAFYTRQLGSAAGGRKARRVNPNEFLAMKLKAPKVDEQLAISTVLEDATEELRLLRAERDALDQQKRGLMQRLLTGKVRVKI